MNAQREGTNLKIDIRLALLKLGSAIEESKLRQMKLPELRALRKELHQRMAKKKGRI